MEQHDIVIVGAGVWGLCAAHTFLTIDPSKSVVIIDSKNSIGGVWATEQLYPGLRTNSIQGYYEYTDFPMTEADVGIQHRGIIRGEAMHDYLARYAELFDLTRRVRLQTRVLRAVQSEDSDSDIAWKLDIATTDDEGAEHPGSVSCGKLVIATGQASAPYTPSFLGLSSFNRPVFHTVDLGRRAQALLDDDTARTITVVGASKSAHDAVYLYATAGKKVNWIIHPASAGRGAVPMSKSYVPLGIWNVWIEALLMVRPLSWFGMAPWSDGDGFGWIRWFLHNTKFGHSLIKGYFASSGNASASTSGILNDEKTKALFPGDTMMWYGTQANVLTYDTDFYELVCSDRVSIIPGNIDHLEEGQICMDNHETGIKTDALILATGYDYTTTVPLEPAGKRLGWGFPVEPSADCVYPELDIQSDKELFSRFPLLNESPSKPERRPALTPWRLWRFLAPPSQVPTDRRDLVFLNAITSYQTLIKCEITSLWAYAYLHNQLRVPTPSEDQVKKEVSLWTRFGKWRAPYGMQGKLADFMLDAVPYYDLLLRDLGLRSWRKGWGWFGEVFGGPLATEDYKGIVQEWMLRQSLPLARGQKKTQ